MRTITLRVQENYQFMCAGAKNVSFCTFQIATAAAATATIITTTTKTTP
jgi:hypothetical protein